MICIRRSEGGNVKRTAPSAVAEWPACSMQPHVTPLFGVQLFYGRPYQVIVKEHYGNDKRSIFVTAFGKSRMYNFQAVEKKNKRAVFVQLISACESLWISCTTTKNCQTCSFFHFLIILYSLWQCEETLLRRESKGEVAAWATRWEQGHFLQALKWIGKLKAMTPLQLEQQRKFIKENSGAAKSGQ